MFYYLNSFFLYSILGFIMESITYFFIGSGGNSGILYGPWTPVYGIGAIIIILVTKGIFRNFKGNRLIKLLAVFLIVTVLLTFIEWLGGTLIEALFHVTFWDYRDYKFHIGKYISLEMSLLWGVLSIAFIYLIKPLFDKFIDKIPKWTTLLLGIAFIVDLIVTVISRL